MPTLALTDFNIICAVLGGFILLFGLISFFAKERLYLSEALIALLVGIAFGPHGADFIRPLQYAQGSPLNVEYITLAFARLVLGVQLVLAGVQLPKKYLLKEWKSLAYLLGPVMTGMWVVSSLLIYAFVPKISLLESLAIAACITPTDPILSNTIVKGKFADKHIRVDLQRIIVAESGSNDGLGYPFLFIALYFIKYVQIGDEGVRKAIGLWFGETMGYTILLSVIYGAVAGWLAKELLHWAEENKLVDRESFLVFAVALALFIVGTCGMIGTDDVLACFIAGNAFTLDDWFRLETMDDSLQPTIDMLLNITIFLWFGAIIPWESFSDNPSVSLGRLIGLAACVIALRRLPVVMLLHRWIPRIETLKEGMFTGYFGPIGVSAIFYLYITTPFLAELEQGHSTEQLTRMEEVVRPVVWICVLASVFVHGITVPFIKLGGVITDTAVRLPSILSRSASLSVDMSNTNLARPRTVIPEQTTGGRSSESIDRPINGTRIGTDEPMAASTVTTSGLPTTENQNSRRNSKDGDRPDREAGGKRIQFEPRGEERHQVVR